MTITDSPEWAAYAALHDGQTFRTLMRVAGSPDDVLLAAMVQLASSVDDWRVMQHTAMLFVERGYTSEAFYFARRAVVASGGDPRARIVLARVHETRRFLDALNQELLDVHRRLRGVRDRTARRALLADLANAFVRLHCYLGRPSVARPWFRYVVETDTGTISTFEQVLHATLTSAEHADMRAIAAVALASVTLPKGSRIQARVELAVRAILIDMLRRRPA